jgi:3D (Asp-Asp-Asp) domain-containing protein
MSKRLKLLASLFLRGSLLAVLLFAFIFSFSLFKKVSILQKSFALDLQKNDENISSSQMVVLNNNSLFPVSSPTSFISNDEKENSLNTTKRVKMLITAYSSSLDETDDDPHITASGKKVKWGIVANNFLPFGTKIKIPSLFGNEVFVVEDRMANHKKIDQIDIWFPSQEEAMRFGVRSAYIEILE